MVKKGGKIKIILRKIRRLSKIGRSGGKNYREKIMGKNLE